MTATLFLPSFISFSISSPTHLEWNQTLPNPLNLCTGVEAAASATSLTLRSLQMLGVMLILLYVPLVELCKRTLQLLTFVTLWLIQKMGVDLNNSMLQNYTRELTRGQFIYDGLQ